MPALLLPAARPAQVTRLALGDRLRRAARLAHAANPLSSPPWTVASPWAAATLYPNGAVIAATVNGIVTYQVQAAGVSVASGSSAPTFRRDGYPVTTSEGHIWVYVGDRPIAANDPAAPTISTASATVTPLGAGNSVLWTPADYPSLYTVEGGEASTYFSRYWSFTTFNGKAGAPIAAGVTVATIVDDSRFSVGFTNAAQGLGLIIDGRFISPSGIAPGTGTPNWYVFDFGLRKPRIVRLVTRQASANFAGIATTPAGFIQAAPAAEVKAVFVADSYGQGSSYGPFRAEGLLGTQIGLRLGWAVTNMAMGGTGVLNPGASAYYTYPQRMADPANAARIAAADVVMLYGSTNDVAYAATDVTAAVRQTLAAIRATNPTAPIVWFGPNALAASTAACKAVDSAVAAGVAASGDPLAFYFPFANAAVPPICGNHIAGLPTGAANIDTLIAHGDNTHPTDLGTSVLGQWMAETIRGQVLPLI